MTAKGKRTNKSRNMLSAMMLVFRAIYGDSATIALSKVGTTSKLETEVAKPPERSLWGDIFFRLLMRPRCQGALPLLVSMLHPVTISRYCTRMSSGLVT